MTPCDPVCVPIRHATRLTDRLRGLLGRHAMATGEILEIAPCAAIHTVGMRFAIDVVFIGRDGHVVRIDRAVGPGRFRICVAARRALEMAAGEADRLGFAVGMQWSQAGLS